MDIVIQTSYFARLKNIEIPVSIAQINPPWFFNSDKFQDYKKLAPPWMLIKDYKDKQISEKEYIKQYYRDVLHLLNPYQVVNELISLFGNNITLLCYEKAGEFCHRRIVADWIEKSTGICVPELVI